jgi:hypothetical protein
MRKIIANPLIVMRSSTSFCTHLSKFPICRQ